MALTTYCELNEIRAALGVSDVELPDAVLSLPVYEIGLVRELNKVSVSLPVAFSAAFNVAEEARSDAQQGLIDATHLFSVYACAKQVGVSLGSMAPKDIGDGKATISRFSDSPYKDVMTRVEAMYAECKLSLVDALSASTGSTASGSLVIPAVAFVASSRNVDPVTGV